MQSKYGWQFSGCPPSKFVSCTICAAFIAYDKFATHESRVTAHAFAHFNCPRALKCHSTINWRQPGLASRKSYILLKIKYSYNLKVNAAAKVSYKRAENKSKGFFGLFNWAKKSNVKIRKKLKIHLGNIMNIYRIVYADPRLTISRDLKSIKKISQWNITHKSVLSLF